MISLLRIKNFALVEDLTIEFGPGFNAITGETGAGKSVILGALKLLVGGRADRAMLRDKADTCSVEAEILLGAELNWMSPFLEENGLEPCEDGRLLIKRSFSKVGTNRQFVNGSPTTVKVLTGMGTQLVDFHGPHDHQSLLSATCQLELLDGFAKASANREIVSDLYDQRHELLVSRRALIGDESELMRKVDLLKYQISEISGANLEEVDEDEIKEELTRATHAGRLTELGQQALMALSGEEGSAQELAGHAGAALDEMASLDSNLNNLVERHEILVDSLRELTGEISHYLEGVGGDPSQLLALQERFTELQNLKRKYGPDLASMIQFEAEARRQLSALENREAELDRLDKELEALTSRLVEESARLSKKRQSAAPRLSKQVKAVLTEIGFKKADLKVDFNFIATEGNGDVPPAIGRTGRDQIEFQFSPNPGESLRPLRSIASSGEMARVMLAFKTVLAQQDEIPILIFDEVDANVGGETGAVVGRKLAQIGETHQTLSVTHLPPVAAAASTHLKVGKSVQGGRSYTHLEKLDEAARIEELARMLGGVTPSSLDHAREMLDSAAAQLG